MARYLFFIAICILLMSCMSMQKKSKINKATNNWSITGKLALSDGKKSGSGKITYGVRNTYAHAQFKAPLGQGSWEIIESNNKTQFLSSRQLPTIGDDAQTLISHELNWDFPWNHLSYWLRGYPKDADITPHKVVIKSIHDDGWIISYSKWINTEKGFLPKKIKASKPPYQVKLVIYKWDFE